MTSDSLRIVSYNCKNLKSSIPEINNLCNEFDVVLLQEHWLHHFELDMLNSINQLFYGRGFSAMNADVMTLGRPFGGLGILWRKSLHWDSVEVESVNKVVMVCKFKVKSFEFNIINVHCPCADDVVEYLDTLGSIDNCLCSLSGDVMILGDFNASKENKFIDYVRMFCEDKNLCLYDDETLDSNTYTYQHIGRGAKSWIDHVVVNANLRNFITKCGVLYDYMLSDHLPLYVTVELKYLNIHIDPVRNSAPLNMRPCYDWSRVDDNIKIGIVNTLRDRLSSLQCQLLDSNDCLNADLNYKTCIDDYYHSIVECFRDVCRQCVPIKVSRADNGVMQNRVIPGWSEQIAELHREARVCYKNWRVAGGPRQGPVYDLMYSSRKLFKSKLRQLRRNNVTFHANNLATKLADKDVQGFWSNLNKNCSKKIVSEQIDGIRGGENIANVWFTKYKDLYSKQAAVEMPDMLASGMRGMNECFHVTDSMVVHGIGQLKCKQDVGDEGIAVEILKLLSQDHIAVNKLVELFNLFFMCGYVPADMVRGTLLPIVKDSKGDLGCSENYRCIAIAGTLSKLFELIVLTYLSDTVAISDAQFGFRKGCSTDLCCDVLKRTVSRFCNEGSYVFACFVDLRKAFDMVNYWKLFEMLLNQGVDKSVVRVLCNIYTSQRMCVRWDGHISNDFSCLNGVRQGSPLSPFLFSVYVDTVLRGIMKLDVGCRIGGHIFNCLAYADDVVLFAPSWKGLQLLMSKLLDLVNEIDMEVNCTKTKCMIFPPAKAKQRFLTDVPIFKLGVTDIAFCSKFRYLGHILTDSLDDRDDVNREIRLLFYRFNRLNCKFKMCSWDVKKMLWISFINCFYGCGMWKVSDSVLQLFIRSYNLCMKKFFGFQKFDRNRDVFVQLGMITPMTIVINARYRCEQTLLNHAFALYNL